MIQASTFRAPIRRRAVQSIPVSFEVDERIRRESVRVAHEVGTHTAGTDHTIRRVVNSAALMVGDVGSLAASVVLAATVRLILWEPMAMPGWIPLLMVLWVTVGLFLRLYPGWGVGPADELRSLFRATLLAGAATIVTLSMVKGISSESRFVLVGSVSIALLVIPLTRYAVRRLLMSLGWWGTTVAVYGEGTTVERLVHLLNDQPHVGLRPAAVFSDDPSLWGHDVEGVPVLGDTHLVHPDAAVAVLAVSDPDRQRALIEGPLRYYRRVLFVPELAEHSALVTNTVDVGGLLGLELRVNLASMPAQWFKRTIDVTATLLTAPVWIGVVAFAAFAVWLEDRRNPFFVQPRMGRGMRSIRVWKIRTMVPDAEGVLARALLQDDALRREWETTAKLQDDLRVTKVGRLVRRLSIDELPQLWNVLRGDMSLVGPRPLPSYHEERLPASGRDMRCRVRPGVTGLWQISGRSDTGDEAMGWLDAYYVRNWSFWLDLAILLRTLRAAIRGCGAY